MTKHRCFICACLLLTALSFTARAADSAGTNAINNQLAPVIEFTLKSGTNRPISAATAKALGLGNEKLLLRQIGLTKRG